MNIILTLNNIVNLFRFFFNKIAKKTIATVTRPRHRHTVLFGGIQFQPEVGRKI